MSYMQITCDGDALVIVLRKPVDVVKYCSIAQKSLEYLNLSTNEFTNKQGVMSTEENFRKLVLKWRKVLYLYNLDLPRNLEPSLKMDLKNRNHLHLPPRARQYHFGEYIDKTIYNIHILVSLDVFSRNELVSRVVSDIERSAEKVGKIRRFLKSIRILVQSERRNCNTLFNCCMNTFLAECKDSNLVMECVKTLEPEFTDWLLFENKLAESLEYILHHAQKSEIIIWNSKFCPIIVSLFIGNPAHVGSLIKYGIKPNFHLADTEQILSSQVFHSTMFKFEDLCPSTFEMPDPEYTLKVRSALLLQVVFVFYLQFGSMKIFRDGTEALRFIWRSIPNHFLSKTEILSIFTPTSESCSKLPSVYNFYKDDICKDEFDLDSSNPRSLSHLSRCTIRGRLSERFALPDGIGSLDLPTRIEKYLRLEL